MSDWPQLVVLGGDDAAAVDRAARDATAALAGVPAAEWPLVTREFTPAGARCRAAAVVGGDDELAAALRDAPRHEVAGVSPVALLFPGQGSQQVGMLAGLVARFPALGARLRDLDDVAREATGHPVLATLYPPGLDTMTADDRATAARELRRTELCQPALIALSAALWELLRDAGVRPVAVAGHSLGEFAAGVAAGAVTAADAVRYAARRGEAMRALELPDQGAMVAVRGSLDAVLAATANVPGVWPANVNHPTQVVLSGTTPGIAAAREVLAGSGMRSTPLDVSHAFHSPLLDGLARVNTDLTDALPVVPPAVPLVSCITGRPLGGPEEVREVWSRHVTSRVDFVATARTCESLGARAYVQVLGADTLTRFARASVERPDDAAYVELTGPGDDVAVFLRGLAALHLLGHDLDTRVLADAVPAAG